MSEWKVFATSPAFVRMAVVELFERRVITDCDAVKRLYNLGFRGKLLDLKFRP